MDITKYTVSKNVKSVWNIPGWIDALQATGNTINDTAAAYSYVPLVFRATTLIANAIGNIPTKFYSLKGETEKEWPFKSGFSTLIWKAVASELLTGSAYWERIQNGYNKPQNVKYRNPYTITPEYNANDGSIKFTQSITNAKWVNYPDRNQYQIVFFNEYNPSNDVYGGIGAAEVALTNAQLMRYIDRFAAKFFEGGAMPVTFLGMDINTPEDEVSRVEKIIKSVVSGISNAWNIVGMKGGAITAQQISPDMKDLVIPELHDQARANIALAFGIPQTMLEDAANFATAKEHRVSFYEETIIPRANQMQDIINEQLLADVGMRLDFDWESLPIFQTDEAERVATAKSYFDMTNDLILSFDLAGIELTEEQKAMIEAAKKPEPEPVPPQLQDAQQPIDNTPQDTPMQEDLKRWQRKALKRLKDGRTPACEFESEYIDQTLHAKISEQLETCQTADEVKAVFDSIKQPEMYELISGLREAVAVLREG